MIDIFPSSVLGDESNTMSEEQQQPSNHSVTIMWLHYMCNMLLASAEHLRPSL